MVGSRWVAHWLGLLLCKTSALCDGGREGLGRASGCVAFFAEQSGRTKPTDQRSRARVSQSAELVTYNSKQAQSVERSVVGM